MDPHFIFENISVSSTESKKGKRFVFFFSLIFWKEIFVIIDNKKKIRNIRTNVRIIDGGRKLHWFL